jgi:hypothetical protein
MQQQDVERIARKALNDLGAVPVFLTVAPVRDTPGVYEVNFGGPVTLRIKCGPGSTAQWVRDQIFEQYQRRT